MLIDPWFFAAAAPAVILVGISKGGFGGTTGLMAVPLMALFISPTAAAAVMLPLLCAMDVLTLWAFRGKWDLRLAGRLAPAAIVGIGLGWASFGYLEENAIRLMVGALAVAFALQNALKELRPARPPAPERPFSGLFWSAATGFTSFVAHAGGPPINIHLLALRLDKTVHQATTVVLFAAINYAKLVPYTALGLFDRSLLLTSLLLAPLAPVGIWLGVRLHHMIDERWFFRIIMAGLAATGIKLIWDAIAAM